MQRSMCYLILIVCLMCSVPHLRVAAQQPDTISSADSKALLDRIDQLERRVRELEGMQEENAGTKAAVEPGQGDQLQPATEEGISSALTDVEKPKTGLQIRGFGQVSVLGSDTPGQRAWFNTGNLTLLVTSQISNKLSATAEIAFDQEGLNSPEFGVVLERAGLRYEHNDYFKIEAGRYYTSIGYYNTAFHNADWAQTAMRRPPVATFQDEGGPMPMQRVGLSVSGRLPSGKLGLHYVAEVGGGDVVRTDSIGLGYEFPIQARPGFNLALFARPQAVTGLQLGGSFYHDSEMPIFGASGNPLVRQNIYSTYVVYVTPKWELLNEAYLIHHDVEGYRKFNIPAFYTQISYRLTPASRPYFRYNYIHAGANDPMLPEASGRVHGLEAGARYNFSEWAGLKFEYARMNIQNPKLNINYGGTQLVFTF